MYHLKNLEKDEITKMNVNVESNHPALDVVTRTFVQIPEVQTVKIKFKEMMKIKDLTYIGISNDATKILKLYHAAA